MQNTKPEFTDIKINASLIIDKRIKDEIEIKEYVKEIETYVNNVEELYIYNLIEQDLNDFYQALTKYNNIQYTNMNDFGDVQNYQIILDELLKTGCDFGVVLKLGYYYEEDAFLTMRRYLTEHDNSKISVLTPLPLRTCELFSRTTEAVRPCMGCELVGTLINMNVFKENSPLKLEYYQSMFDYEYCLRTRNKGYKVLLMQNEVLRNRNYRVIEKRILFSVLSMFDYDLMDLYYQTRNRFYLWEEYENIDPKFVKLDKKLFKGERHTLKVRDKNYRDKFYMMEEARYDFHRKLKGKYGGNQNEKA